MIRGVIFDMDGVLVDNIRVHWQVFRDFFKTYGVEVTDDQLSQVNGWGNDQIIPHLLPESIVSKYGVEWLAAQKEAMYRQYYASTIHPAEGLVELLTTLQRAGIKCAVGSSGPKENVQFVLDSCHIGHFFDVIINGDMVTRCKPDPEIFLTAQQMLNLPAAECIVCEDAVAGVTAARRAGIVAVVGLTTSTSASSLIECGASIAVPDFTCISLDALRALGSSAEAGGATATADQGETKLPIESHENCPPVESGRQLLKSVVRFTLGFLALLLFIAALVFLAVRVVE